MTFAIFDFEKHLAIPKRCNRSR